MPVIAVNVIKVLFAIALYGFLFYVARAMRGHVAGPPADPTSTPAPSSRRRGRPDDGQPPPAPRRFALHVVDPSGTTRTVLLEGRLIVGRSSTADVTIQDDYASERHAAFEVTQGAPWVEDLGSTNGTLLDGAKVTRRTRVEPGAVVVVGHTRVTVR